jgi:hypothetical protein
MTESASIVLDSFESKGLDWSEACLYCTDMALDCHAKGDTEGLKVWRDRAFEIDKARNSHHAA